MTFKKKQNYSKKKKKKHCANTDKEIQEQNSKHSIIPNMVKFTYIFQNIMNSVANTLLTCSGPSVKVAVICLQMSTHSNMGGIYSRV